TLRARLRTARMVEKSGDGEQIGKHGMANSQRFPERLRLIELLEARIQQIVDVVAVTCALEREDVETLAQHRSDSEARQIIPQILERRPGSEFFYERQTSFAGA